MTYTQQHLDETRQVIERLDVNAIERLANLLAEVRTLTSGTSSRNEVQAVSISHAVDGTFTTILGREAAYSGAGVAWEDILNSKFAYGPEQLLTNCGGMQWPQTPHASSHVVCACCWQRRRA